MDIILSIDILLYIMWRAKFGRLKFILWSRLYAIFRLSLNKTLLTTDMNNKVCCWECIRIEHIFFRHISQQMDTYFRVTVISDFNIGDTQLLISKVLSRQIVKYTSPEFYKLLNYLASLGYNSRNPWQETFIAYCPVYKVNENSVYF